jgi:serine/threonine-protein kinase CHEK1
MEISLHKHIGQHQNIIEFYDHGDDTAWVWIAMELAEGGDLFDKIEADAGVAEDIAHIYFTQLVSAVDYMHTKGVAHRDIKPENVLLSADGDLKIADFGMSTLFEYHGRRKLATTLCGSPPYVAPEVLSCSTQGATKGPGYAADMADIWSCGVVLFVLLAGNTPWSRPVEGQDEYGRPNEFSEYVQSNGKPADELWEALPQSVLSLLRGMMKVDVGRRFSIEDIRRHPWYTRPNKLMNRKGRLVDPIAVATNMFESLRVDFDADPFAGTQRSAKVDAMDVDGDIKPKYAATQPETPAEDMLFDWDRPKHPAMTSTQLVADLAIASQSISATKYLEDEPSMSQFQPNPSVPLSRTQMARRFADVLPPNRMTIFYSKGALDLLVPFILDALAQLDMHVSHRPRPSEHDTECSIKVKGNDGRGCPLSGTLALDVVGAEVEEAPLVRVLFVKAAGDPLEWRRFFKRVAVLCERAVFKPEF